MNDSGETDRVLVVDDDPGIRELLISALGFVGFAVDAAGGPTEALAQVARRAYGGSGLGLAIVEAIIHAHHGKVTVESSVGVGTTVRVRLAAR